METEEQNLGYFLIDVGKGKIIKQEKLPLSPDSILTWLSFTDYGVLIFI
jgi:hypothetical protein